MRNEPPNKVLK